MQQSSVEHVIRPKIAAPAAQHETCEVVPVDEEQRSRPSPPSQEEAHRIMTEFLDYVLSEDRA